VQESKVDNKKILGARLRGVGSLGRLRGIESLRVSRVLRRNQKSQEVKDLGWELKILVNQRELGV
jgi:hypothetical protein